jgi:hypothetical protein
LSVRRHGGDVPTPVEVAVKLGPDWKRAESTFSMTLSLG